MISKVCIFGLKKCISCKLNRFYQLKIGLNRQKNRFSVSLLLLIHAVGSEAYLGVLLLVKDSKFLANSQDFDPRDDFSLRYMHVLLYVLLCVR